MTMPQTRIRIKLTLTAVARLESMPRTPILENSAVREANTAERTAYTCHMIPAPYTGKSPRSHRGTRAFIILYVKTF